MPTVTKRKRPRLCRRRSDLIIDHLFINCSSGYGSTKVLFARGKKTRWCAVPPILLLISSDRSCGWRRATAFFGVLPTPFDDAMRRRRAHAVKLWDRSFFFCQSKFVVVIAFGSISIRKLLLLLHHHRARQESGIAVVINSTKPTAQSYSKPSPSLLDAI